MAMHAMAIATAMMMQCDDGCASTVDKENNGGQRGDERPRISALGAILFGTQQPDSASEADTHSLSASTDVGRRGSTVARVILTWP